jgi:two-component system nitrogen regulation response regulator NtrX
MFLPETIALLSSYDWPGNVRELRNIIERILIMTPGKTITPADIPVMFSSNSQVSGGKAGSQFVYTTLREAREGFERDFIVQKLEENDWNISRTADIIELERSNLHRKIKAYGIDVRK